MFDVDIVCDAQARRMKGIVEASRKEPIRQRDAGIAPPQDDSDKSSPEDLPEGDGEEGVPDYMPEETHGQEMTTYSAEAMGNPGDLAVDKAAAEKDNQAGSSSSKGKEKIGESSKPTAFSCGTHSPHSAANELSATFQGAKTTREHPSVMALEIPTPAESILTAPACGGAEMRHPDPNSEDPAADLNTRGRQSRKRKASFSPGRPTPKIPLVVAYINSSSGDEGEAEVGRTMIGTPPRDQVKDNAGGSADSPLATSTAGLSEASVGGLGPSTQAGEPTPETMLRAMASGRAYIGGTTRVASGSALQQAVCIIFSIVPPM